MTEKALKGNRAKPTNYSQWKLLRKYGKQEGILQAKKPSIDNQIGINTQALVNDYSTFVAAVDDQYGDVLNGADCCGQGKSSCCFQPFDMLLIESHYLSKMINKNLSQEKRLEVIERAVAMTRKLRDVHRESPGLSSKEFQQRCRQSGFRCPLLGDEGGCLALCCSSSPLPPLRGQPRRPHGGFCAGRVETAFKKCLSDPGRYISSRGQSRFFQC